MVAYIELSAKDISYLQLLEDSFTTLAIQMVKSRREAETNPLPRPTTPGIYMVSSQEEEETKLFTGATAPGKQVIRSRQEADTRSHTRAPRAAASRRTVRTSVPEDFTSSANDWVILAAPDERVPDYVVLAQEKKRSEPNRCSC